MITVIKQAVMTVLINGTDEQAKEVCDLPGADFVDLNSYSYPVTDQALYVAKKTVYYQAEFGGVQFFSTGDVEGWGEGIWIFPGTQSDVLDQLCGIMPPLSLLLLRWEPTS